MSDLFAHLPVQRAPTQIVVGRHALVRCHWCDGTGTLSFGLGPSEIPCHWCNGGGVRLRVAEE